MATANVQWDVEKHERIRLRQAPRLRGDLTRSLAGPDVAKVLCTIRRERSFYRLDRACGDYR